MGKLSQKEIRKTDNEVIINADEGSKYLSELDQPYFLLTGEYDYVQVSESAEISIVDSGHTSPI